MHKFDKKVFQANNIQVSIKLEQIQMFASYRNGEMTLKPLIKDIGRYKEAAKISNKKEPGPAQIVEFNIIVQEPRVKKKI